MDIEVSRPDLLDAGFVPFVYLGPAIGTGMYVPTEHPTYLVHASMAEKLIAKGADQDIAPVLMPLYDHVRYDGAGNALPPIIRYWEAKWGAQWFRLRTYAELHGFMTLFNYQS